MFSNATFDSVGFDSVKEEVKKSTNASLQTDEVIKKDTGEQYSDLLDKNVQSEPFFEDRQAKYDENKLIHFLNRVTGPLLKELDKIERSKAFTAQRSYAENELSEQEVEELYTLTGQVVPDIPDVKVSSLSWSSTGNVIAIGVESISHEGWCTHESVVNFYNISSHKFDGTIPTNRIQSDSCITCVAMHPYEPSLVVLGTHSGNLEVWTIGKDNRKDGICISKEQYHEDRITQVSWANDSSQQLILVSSSLDGRMCILKNPSVGSPQLIDKYILNPEGPDVLRPGISCFSFCVQQPGTFVAALEIGQLMLCSTFGSNNTTYTSSGLEKSPVLRTINKQIGHVTHIKFSPHNCIFLVATQDAKITVYSIQDDSVLIELFSDFDIYGADWSPVQEKIIIAWGKSPKILVYNQDTGQRIKEFLPKGETVSKNRIYHKALFNTKSTKLLALAGTDGKSYIWSIPTYFKT